LIHCTVLSAPGGFLSLYPISSCPIHNLHHFYF
jgi:hypothetical protein